MLSACLAKYHEHKQSYHRINIAKSHNLKLEIMGSKQKMWEALSSKTAQVWKKAFPILLFCDLKEQSNLSPTTAVCQTFFQYQSKICALELCTYLYHGNFLQLQAQLFDFFNSATAITSVQPFLFHFDLPQWICCVCASANGSEQHLGEFQMQGIPDES